MTDQPRALCAVSSDRQWLVVLHPDTGRWMVHDLCHWGYQHYEGWREDAGQSAEDVLHEFLEGRDG